MAQSECGQEQLESFSFSSMVILSLLTQIIIDHKKDVVTLIPDLQKPYLIHSCSMDRSISTYDLK